MLGGLEGRTGPGFPALVSVAIPNDAMLVGMTGYAQGLLIDGSGTTASLGLTEAVCFTLTN